MNKNAFLVAAGLLILFIFSQSFFTVEQTRSALVLQFGKPVGAPKGPGFHFKLPVIQNVIYFESWILEYDAKPAEVITKDKKTLVLDNYTKWRIVDPLLFYQTVTDNRGARERLEDIIYSNMREAVGRFSLTEVVSGRRQDIMAQVTEKSSQQIKKFGIDVLDVRIKRADLPAENERAVFDRMRAERERQAKQYRSEGKEESAKIKSLADRDKVVILAEAKQKSEGIRGHGDAEAIRIYAEAVKQAPEFYVFKRSLDAYVKSFEQGGEIILTPDSEFLKYLR